MPVQSSPADALRAGLSFVAIMVAWIVVTAIVYGSFVALWPDVPEAEPWIHLGVYLVPLVGYLGHTLQHALASSRPEPRAATAERRGAAEP